MKLNHKVLPGGFKPTRAHDIDAGFDLYTPNDFTVSASGFTFVKLKVCIEIPAGYVGFLMGRSGLASKGLNIFTGVIDAGYTGELGCIVFNANAEPVNLYAGERIAQLVICKLADIDQLVSEPFAQSERGANGFGSSGK